MKKLSLLGVLFVSFALVGCTQPVTNTNQQVNQQQPAQQQETWPIKIGVIAPLSGPASSYGADVMHGYETVAKMINDAGGINGRMIQLIIEDGKCTGKDATSAVQKLLNVDKVVAILGGACSGETIPAGKLAQQQGVPLISATASSPEISSIGDYVFRYWNDADAGVVMVEELEKMEADSIALIYEGTDYAAAYADVIRQWFDGELVMEEKFLSEEKDFWILAKNIVDEGDAVDAIVFIPQSEAAAIAFIKAIDNEGVWSEYRSKFLGTETVMSETTAAELGDLVNGMQGVRFPELANFGDTAERAAAILEGYEAKTAAIFTVFAADSLDLLAEAIEEVGVDGAAIKDYIATYTVDNQRNKYVSGFYFNEFGDGQGIPFTLVTFKDGELTTVE